MMTVTEGELSRRVKAAFDREPRLTAHGYGTFETPGRAGGPHHARDRADLERNLDRATRVATWLLANVAATKGVGRGSSGSYGLKHVYERATGEYVTNGELIVAALAAGYPTREEGSNAGLGTSARDVRRVDPENRRR